MKKADLLSTLFVGIDVSSRENVVCAIDFEQQKRLRFSVPNNQPGAIMMAEKLQQFFSNKNGKYGVRCTILFSQWIWRKKS